MNAEILHQDIQSLLEWFSKNLYRAAATRNQESFFGNEVLNKCHVLMKIDYNVIEISNSGGELTTHYPATILIPEYEHQNQFNPITNTRQQTIYESTYDASKLRDLIIKARFARCRLRFPLPIILYKGKYICRSSTLSGGPEIYTRSGLDYFFAGSDSNSTAGTSTATRKTPPLDEDAEEAQESSINVEAYSEPRTGTSEWQLFDRVRNSDIRLLKTFNVQKIVDFMVEKKKVKFLMNVTSSEKVDKEKRYQEFQIISLPYPGCEFFREFRDNNYSGEGLVFDWTQKSADAEIRVPQDNVMQQLNIDFDMYKNWDLIVLTQNYMKLLLKYLQENSSGLLIHCISGEFFLWHIFLNDKITDIILFHYLISLKPHLTQLCSGWDRTPLFVSLLRLSLWADGLIHQSLSAIQMLYFTIGYDWMMFGHDLPDRLSKGEEIFFFCFYMLKYLIDDEFSIAGQRFRSSKQSSSGSSSIGVIRTDSDVFDGMLFDGDSRGSSISLNSTCSARSQQEHNLTASSNGVHSDDNNANANGGWVQEGNGFNGLNSSTDSANILNFSPQLQKRTSPMSVPKIANQENKSHRQRQESSSSMSVGSWQLISDTGSLRSQNSNIPVANEHNNNSSSSNHAHSSSFQPNMCSNQNGSGSATVNNSTHESSTIVDDDCFTANDYFMRRERLNSVRTLFYNCYSSTIGYSFRNGNFNSLLGNFAEKVGLTQPRTSDK